MDTEEPRVVISNNEIRGSAISIGKNAEASVSASQVVDIGRLQELIQEANGELARLPVTTQSTQTRTELSKASSEVERGEQIAGVARLRIILNSAAASILSTATVAALKAAIGMEF